MKVDFDLESRLAAPFDLSAGNHLGEPIDWHGLRARMTAAYAAHAMLAFEKPRETSIPSGSFDQGSARVLAVYAAGPSHELEAINPIALANGNSGSNNSAAAAGANPVSD